MNVLKEFVMNLPSSHDEHNIWVSMPYSSEAWLLTKEELILLLEKHPNWDFVVQKHE